MPVTFINSGRFGAAAFTPLSLSPFMWYDASDAATITIATGVSQWDDKSGNARHLTQGTGANQPAYSGTQNGLNVVTFDGSNDFLATGNLTVAQPMTVFTVAKLTTNGGQGQITGASGTAPVVYKRITTHVWAAYAGTARESATANDLAVHQMTTVFDGVSSSIRLDGSSIASGTTGTNGYSAAPMIVGANPGGTNPMTGFIAEIVVCAAALSTTDRDACEAYLKARWATP